MKHIVHNLKKLNTLLLLLALMGVSEMGWGQSYLGLDGGFEGAASIDNTVNSSAQANKWTKNNASQTIANETTIVRSGVNSLSATNGTTGRRIWSPLITVSSTTSQVTIQYFRRVTSTTNSQETQHGIGNGTTTGEGLSGSYTSNPTANEWQKVTYTRSSWTYTNIAGTILHRQIGTGGTIYIDDVAMYTGGVDNTAPNPPTSPIIGTATASSLNIAWTAASGGVDNGGYLVVRGTSDPTTAPNVNGIYAVNNTIGTGTVVYQGTGTSFTDNGLAAGTQYFYRIYTYDKAYNYSGALTGNGSTSSGSTATITLNPTTLNSFTYAQGSGPSIEQTFTVSGSNLTADISLAASDNYEISKTSGTGYTTPLTFTQTSGSVAEQTVYVRLKAGLSVGNYNSEVITASSTGATNKTVTCSGSVTAAPSPALIAAVGATVDAPFDVTFTDDATWRAAITSITVNGSTLSASAYSTTSAGQITFTPSASALLQSSGAKSIVVIATGYSNATVSQTLGAGVPTKLGITTQPTAPATNGGALAIQPVVRIQDQYNNTTTSTATVVATVGAGAWTLGGTTSVAGLEGTVTYSGLTATSAAAVTGATISFSSGSLTGITSNAFNIPAPAPANDNCSGAIEITVNSSAIIGDILGATQSLSASCGGTANNDVWFSFTTGSAANYTISVVGSPSFDAVIDLRSGSCNGSNIACADATYDGGTESIAEMLQSNTTYLLRVYDWGSDIPATTTFSISITGPIDAPIATSANPIGSTSFTANWNASASATNGYKLDVSSTAFNFASTTETFSSVGGGTTSNYLTRTWTGVDGITWTSYKTRTDQVIFTGNAAICLQDAADAYLVSGEITGPPSNLTFDIQQKFSGSGGNVVVKILSGVDFSTVTTIGTYSYNTTASVISTDVTGIAGPFKVQIENGNTNARPCIDNLAVTRDSFTPVSVFNNYSVPGTSQSVGSLSPNTTYYYRVRAVGPNSTSANSNVITVTTGANKVSSEPGDWNSITWSPAGVPVSKDDVTINHAVTLTGQASCHNLTIGTGGSLTVNSDGSLLPTGTATGTVTLKRNVGEATWTDPADGWHLLSSPVAAQVISPAFTETTLTDYDFFAWDEASNMWLNQKVAGNNITTFAPGKGYLVSYKNGGTKSFTGALNVTDQPVSLTKTGSSTYAGYNLIGNPFSSAITWGTGWTLENTGGVAYVWDESGKDYISRSAGDPIPAMNGFMVYLSSGTSQQLTIPASARQHNGQAWFKSSGDRIVLHAIDKSNNSFKENIVRFKADATENFDLAYDGYYLQGYAPKFYSVSGNEYFSVNTLPEVTESLIIPLGFEKTAAEEFSIEMKESIPGAIIFLTDKKTNTVTNLTQNPVYSFTAAPGDDASRFSLHFASVGLGETPATQSVLAYYHDGALYVNNTEAGAEIMLFGISGQLLKQQTATAGLNTLQAGKLSAGVYVVRVQSAAGTYSSKVIVTR